MSGTTGRLLGLVVLLGLAACQPQPYLPMYSAPAPPPLQPYVAAPAAYAPAVRRHIVRRRYVRRHYVRHHVPAPVNCPCIPPKQP